MTRLGLAAAVFLAGVLRASAGKSGGSLVRGGHDWRRQRDLGLPLPHNRGMPTDGVGWQSWLLQSQPVFCRC